MLLPYALISTPSRAGMVAFDDTALETLETAATRSVRKQVTFTEESLLSYSSFYFISYSRGCGNQANPSFSAYLPHFYVNIRVRKYLGELWSLFLTIFLKLTAPSTIIIRLSIFFHLLSFCSMWKHVKSVKDFLRFLYYIENFSARVFIRRAPYLSRIFLMVSSTSSLILRSFSICFCTFCRE